MGAVQLSETVDWFAHSCAAQRGAAIGLAVVERYCVLFFNGKPAGDRNQAMSKEWILLGKEDLQGDLLCQQRVLFFTFDGAQVLLLS
jgi:hypothetical protein